MTVWTVVTAVTALATAASGGAFLTYSSFTARALGALPDGQGLAAMREVNLAAPRSTAFMALVFGPALASVVLGVRAVTGLDRAGAGATLAGSLVYLVGVAGMTAVFHVPRNNILVALDVAEWPRWLRRWVAGNHVRTVSGLLAGGLLLLAAGAG